MCLLQISEPFRISIIWLVFYSVLKSFTFVLLRDYIEVMIGGKRGKLWEWVDGSAWLYEGWDTDTGQPNGGGMVRYLKRNGAKGGRAWDDGDELKSYPFLCMSDDCPASKQCYCLVQIYTSYRSYQLRLFSG